MASQHSAAATAYSTSRWSGRAALVVLGALTLMAPVTPAVAAEGELMVHPGPPTVDGAQAALSAAQTERTDAMARRTQMQVDLAATRQEISALGLEQVALINELEIARRRARVVTVRAYTGGGGARELDYLKDAGDVGDRLYRQELLTGNVVDTHEAIDAYEELQTQADEQVIELAERVDDLQSGIEQAASDIELAADLIERAQVELSAAQAAARQNAGGHTDPGEGAWERLRFCEGGGVYTTNTGNGFYGAYQFDLQTWRSMGGTGAPSAAPYWEQDLRAKALFQARGAQPWPICGRFLD